MLYVTITICVCFIAGSRAEVELKKGVAQNVTFEGSELNIRLDNPSGTYGEVMLCFGSTSTNSGQCPNGYVSYGVTFTGNVKANIMKVTRDGRVFLDAVSFNIVDGILFDENGVLSILVSKLPDPTTTVTLLNAVVYVPEEKEPVETESKDSKATVIGITVGVVLAVLALIAVATTVGIVCYCRKRKHKPANPALKATPKKNPATPAPSPQTGGRLETTPTKSPMQEPVTAPSPSSPVLAKPAPVPKPAEKPAPKTTRPLKPKLPAETPSVETVTQTSVEAPSRPESAEPSQVIVTVTSPPKETKHNTGGGSLKVDNTQSESLSLKWF
uniref:Uncharacterized protein n=1 Tax=Panagrellus redivivus TaxID=6233 RepID=A0A7E5A055_PANRE